MSNDSDWLGGSGFGGEHIDKARKESKSKGKLKFFLEKGSTKNILFLDDKPQWVYEHSAKKLNRKGKTIWPRFTCRKGMEGGCPGCNSDLSRIYTGYLTILDLTGYTDKDGQKHVNIRKLFPLGIDDDERFSKFAKKNDGLTGWIVEVTRYSKKKSRTIGDDFEFVKRVDPFKDKEYFFHSKLEGVDKPPEPYDYREALMPLSAEDMRYFISDSFKDTGDDDAVPDGGGDDDVPY